MSLSVWSYFFLFILFLCISRNVAKENNSSVSDLGGPCRNIEQCQTPNSTCSDGVCSCLEGFFQLTKINISSCESDAVDKTDDPAYSGNPPKVKQQHIDPKMIIIMVVLAVMFVGICVALHLFSKARFRNHRTIFNSPHPRLMHIKLGKKKGKRNVEGPGSRQLSICSQLSPLQSRRGSQITSPELNAKNNRTNGEKKESFSHKPHKQQMVEKDVPNAGPGSPKVIIANNSNKPSSARV